MSFFDMFKSAPTSGPTNPNGTPMNPADQQKAAANGNPTVPNATNTPVLADTTGTAEVSPLAAYTDLWQDAPNNQAQNVPLFSVDPKKLQEAASKINFGQVISADAMAAIAAGGEGAQKAFAESMTKVAQATFAQSTATTAKLIEQALARNNTDLDARIPTLIRSQTVSELNRADNPLFSNPATAPIMSALEKQFQLKNPNATAAEIQSHTRQYLQEFVNLANAPQAAAAAKKTASSETDWDSFL